MNIIKLLIVLLSTSIVQLEASDTVVHGDALKGELWLTSTDELNAIVRKDKIGQVHDFYEVVASKVVSAVGTFLEKASIVEISEVQAKRLVGLNYVCPPGKKSYLVRAVYGSGATGRFHVERLGTPLSWFGIHPLGMTLLFLNQLLLCILILSLSMSIVMFLLCASRMLEDDTAVRLLVVDNQLIRISVS